MLQNIITFQMILCFPNIWGKPFLFQHDNALGYTARSVFNNVGINWKSQV
uniref:Uncharacterized protein n=1 Tax=Anguilla anguilla TaxID=7936 RepID=A0A0E9QDN1_ANGAN